MATNPIVIHRDTWEVLERMAGRNNAGSAPPSVPPRATTMNVVTVKSEAAIPAGAPVAVRATVGDVDASGVWMRSVRHFAEPMGAVAPDDAAPGVAIFDIDADGFGPVLLRGTHGVLVDVVDTNHSFAVGDGVTAFRSAEEGPYRIIGKKFSGTGLTPAVVSFPVGGGGGAGVIFPVVMTQTGGFPGEHTAQCSFVYTVDSFPPGDDPLAEGLNPGVNPSKHRRPNLGKMTAADFGTAMRDPDTGDLIIVSCNEVMSFKGCEE